MLAWKRANLGDDLLSALITAEDDGDMLSEDELRVLRRIGAKSNVRLACQLRPRGAVEVTPLLDRKSVV